MIFSENAISDAIFQSKDGNPGIKSNGTHPGSKLKTNSPGSLASIFQDDKRPGDISLLHRIKSPFTDKYELLNEDGFLGRYGNEDFVSGPPTPAPSRNVM